MAHAEHRGDVASVASINVGLLIRLNLDQAADTFLGSSAWIENGVPLRDGAGVDAEECEFAELVAPEFKREGAEWRMIAGLGLDSLAFIIRMNSLSSGNIERARKVVDDGVEGVLNTLVFKSRTTSHRNERIRDGRAAQASFDCSSVDGLFFEEHHANLFIDVSKSFEEEIVGLVSDLLLIGIKILNRVSGAEQVVIGVDNCFLVHHVDLPLEVIFGADRDQNWNRIACELLANIVDRLVEVGTDAIHLVDEGDARDFVFVSLTPDGLRLRLDARNTTEDGNCTVENPERTLDLSGEIDVTRGVDNVDLLLNARGRFGDASFLALRPFAANRCGGDGDSPLLLLLHPVRSSSPIMYLTDLVYRSCVEQDSFSEGRLPRINVRTDADIPRPMERNLAIL